MARPKKNLGGERETESMDTASNVAVVEQPEKAPRKPREPKPRPSDAVLCKMYDDSKALKRESLALFEDAKSAVGEDSASPFAEFLAQAKALARSAWQIHQDAETRYDEAVRLMSGKAPAVPVGLFD